MYFSKTEPKTVGEAVARWTEKNGAADMRYYLDRYFWSYQYSARNITEYIEVEAWCNQTLGADNWHREFSKFWFTSNQEYVMFSLTWNRESS